MALPICLALPAFDDPFDFVMPGPLEVADVNPMKITQLNLAPLVPFFDMFDMIVTHLQLRQSNP